MALWLQRKTPLQILTDYKTTDFHIAIEEMVSQFQELNTLTWVGSVAQCWPDRISGTARNSFLDVGQ